MSEAQEKQKLMRSMKRQGVPAQRFEDQFSVGTPDMFIGSGQGDWPGVWLEAKFHEVPKMGKTPLLPKAKITGNQRNWLERFDGKPNPSAVIHFTGDRWLVCPISRLHILTELPSGQTRKLLRALPVSRVMLSDLWDSYQEVLSYGR